MSSRVLLVAALLFVPVSAFSQQQSQPSCEDVRDHYIMLNQISSDVRMNIENRLAAEIVKGQRLLEEIKRLRGELEKIKVK